MPLALLWNLAQKPGLVEQIKPHFVDATLDNNTEVSYYALAFL